MTKFQRRLYLKHVIRKGEMMVLFEKYAENGEHCGGHVRTQQETLTKRKAMGN